MRSVLAIVSFGVAITAASLAQAGDDPVAVFEHRCEPAHAATDYASWEYIANNAVRTADEYATVHNPRATFILGDVDAVFQAGGDYAGQYLVKIVAGPNNATSFAMLRPNFEFCADPSSLNDSRDDLFTVVVAKFNGRPF